MKCICPGAEHVDSMYEYVNALSCVSMSLGYKMKKRVGAIEEFMFLPLSEGRQLHITIAITGWLGSGRYREDQGGEGLR